MDIMDYDLPAAPRPAKKKRMPDFDAAIGYVQHALLCPAIAACVSGPLWIVAPAFLAALALVTAADHFLCRSLPRWLRALIKTAAALILYFVIAMFFSDLRSSASAVLLGAVGSAAIYSANSRCDAVREATASGHIFSRLASAATAALAVCCAAVRL